MNHNGGGGGGDGDSGSVKTTHIICAPISTHFTQKRLVRSNGTRGIRIHTYRENDTDETISRACV